MKAIPQSIRRIAIAGAAVLVLGGAAVGIAAAQAQPATPAAQQTPYQKFIAALASHFGVSSQEMETQIGAARQAAGLPAGNQFPGRPGPGGPGRFGFGFDLETAANTIGVTPQQLRTDLQTKSLAQIAQEHGKTAAEVATAMKNAAHQRIDQAVTNGRLTQDQANTAKTQIDQRIDQFMNQVLPQRGANPGRGRGPAGAFGPGALRMGFETAASVIGITPEQLRTDLPGKSLTQVAQMHNKSRTDLVNGLEKAAHDRIDQAVTAGRLTQDQANTAKTQIDQRIGQLVDQVVPQGGFNPNRGPGRGPGGPGGDQQADTGA